MDGTEPLPVVLARLADAAATGCLHVRGGGTARLHLREGRLQGLALPARPDARSPGSRSPGSRSLGSRLLAAGLVSPAALAEAEQAQRSELQGWRLGELLVHLGHVEPAAVATHVRDQLVDDLQSMLSAPYTSARFRPGERVRGDLAAPLDVRPLLATLGHQVGALLPPEGHPVPAVPAVPVDGPVCSPGSSPVALEPLPEPAPIEPAQASADTDHDPSDAELAAANTRDFADAFAAFESGAGTVEAAPSPSAAPAVRPDPDPEPSADPHDPSWDRRDTDTAALLRELSSLGGAEPSPAPGAPPTPPTPAAATASIAAQRKRKGLFGRV